MIQYVRTGGALGGRQHVDCTTQHNGHEVFRLQAADSSAAHLTKIQVYL